MSTNKIQDLDAALIRTGRADRLIEFTNATKEQARDMFISAYTGTRWVEHQAPSSRGVGVGVGGSGGTKAPLRLTDAEDWTDEDVTLLAGGFADAIRDREFSPALLQQFFKDFRAEPRRAVAELEKWMDDPRGYRKPALQPRSPEPEPDATPLGSVRCSSVGAASPPGASDTSSALDDLMSLDDLNASGDGLGGYKEPACFGSDFEAGMASPHGPLVDIS